MSFVPRIYVPGPRPGMDLPLYWRNEQTGELPAAVEAYLEISAGIRQELLSTRQLEILLDYIRYHIKAPCWATNCKSSPDLEADLKRAILMADLARTIEDIHAFIEHTMTMGIDPL